jgi:D-alanyl-D-alanine dipeptidase
MKKEKAERTKPPLHPSKGGEFSPFGGVREGCFLLISLFLICFPIFCQPVDWDKRLESMGFVDIRSLDSTIQVHLIYATASNFMNKPVYEGITKAWLHPDAAKKIVQAQQNLKREHPAYSLLVYDAARPMEVQRQMWELVRGTQYINYVSNPANQNGRHNYGMAVDVTIVDEAGRPLPMGTPFDFFGEEANTDKEEALVKAGKINENEFQNRRLLRRVMQRAGFTTVTSEWWHFNACSSEEAKTKYKIIDN